MEVLETKNKNKKYKPILDGIPDWPVYQLSRNRKEFIEEVTREALLRIKHLRPGPRQLADELETTVYREQQRIKRNRRRVDPPDESRFWAKIKEDLTLPASADEEAIHKNAAAQLQRVVARSASELAGDVTTGTYRRAREAAECWFSRLLGGARVKKFGAFVGNEYSVRDKIYIVGKVKHLRRLG